MKLARCEMCFGCFLLLFCILRSQELEDSEGGNFLFLSKNDEVADEKQRTRRSKSESKPTCEDSTLSSYLASLQVINPESVIALATKNKLGHTCHEISKTSSKMGSYLKTCNLEVEQEQYVKLLRAVEALHKKLCNKDHYYKSFIEHKKCYNQLQTQVGSSCNGPADWSENSDSKRLCRAYQEIRDCYFVQTSVLCGNKAAEIFRELVQCIIESVLTVNCTINVVDDGQARPSKEQWLAMQEQKLGQTKSETVETSSCQPLRVSGLLTVLIVTSVSKFIVEKQYINRSLNNVHVFWC